LPYSSSSDGFFSECPVRAEEANVEQAQSPGQAGNPGRGAAGASGCDVPETPPPAAATPPEQQADVPTSVQTTPDDLAALVEVALAPVQIYGLTVRADRRGRVTLQGSVRTETDFQQAARLAMAAPGVSRLTNQLVVETLVGSEPVVRTVTNPELAAELELNSFHVASGTEQSFNDQVGTTDTAESDDEAVPYFAPTDPPTRRAPRDAQGYEVVGGFAQTSLSAPIDFEQLPTALQTGDDEIARRVRLALLEDAATADLPIHVTVRGGVVRLRGVVTALIDADQAQAVAANVPNVVEVIDELEVPGM
jgi:osmotically-inducible protein OsmY